MAQTGEGGSLLLLAGLADPYHDPADLVAGARLGAP